MVTVLAGGVGAARLLSGLVAVTDPSSITAIVNTGDDVILHGLHISPDLDTVTYTLAGAINAETGWGRADESWRTMEALERYGGTTWFRLGDLDLATHLYRTQRLSEGATLSTVTAEVAEAWDLALRILPMSDDRVETRVTLAGEGGEGGGEIGFQEYFVARRHAVAVAAVRFAGADDAQPAPGALDAIDRAPRIVIAPSNPIVSIGPILAVPGVAAALGRRRRDTVAVSPIVAGAALKGPADRMLAELGHERSVVGVARLYAPYAATLIVDEADAGLAPDVEREGLDCVVVPAVMHGPAEAAALARVTLHPPNLRQ
jgi:LPPG:FO 2-phospho-L-lactate transferase